MTKQENQQRAESVVLSGWKDIASYLGKGVRTVQRYERDLRLPVRRPAGKLRGSVLTTKSDLDGWVLASALRKPIDVPSQGIDLQTRIDRMKTLCEETVRLRDECRVSRERLCRNIRSIVPCMNGEMSRRIDRRISAPKSHAKWSSNVVASDAKMLKAG
jgi:hypothetical protein